MVKPPFSQVCGDLPTLNRIHEGNMAAHLGIVITAVGPDYIRAAMPVDHRTRQPFGLLHGGASAALAEALGSVASWLVVGHLPGARVAGLDISTSHLKAVTSGHVHGVCRPLRVGRTVHFWRIDIFDDTGEQTGAARLTVSVGRKRSGGVAG